MASNLKSLSDYDLNAVPNAKGYRFGIIVTDYHTDITFALFDGCRHALLQHGVLAEDIEDMDPGQAEAVKATGAGWFQWINYAVQPQVMPRMIGLSVYRLDINFRESAVVGIVGGGGIGAG